MTQTTTSNQVIEKIGNTPLVELSSFSTDSIKLFAKLDDAVSAS